MLKVFFGLDYDANLYVDVFFNHVFEHEWLEDDLVKEMIKDIDNSEVLSPYCIQSPILGQIPSERLSGGVKTLIMLYKMDDFYTDLIVCGENCEKWISKISQLKDITVSMSGYDLVFKDNPISGICLNDGSTFKGSKEWAAKCIDFIDTSERGEKPITRIR